MKWESDLMRDEMRVPLILIAGLFCQTVMAQDVFDPPKSRLKFEARKAKESIKIDGRLTETDWWRCPVASGFLQVEPNQGDSTLFQTDVRILFDAEHLYIGAYCRDTIGYAGVRVPDLRRDFDFFTNDLFSVSIDGFYDQRSAMAFQVNPYGALRDLLVFDDRLFDRDWDGVWTAATQVSDSGWTVEMAIPFATLRYSVPRETTTVQMWGIQFTRIIRRENQVTSLPLFPRAYTPYRMSYAGD